jgi:hypothetical protein
MILDFMPLLLAVDRLEQQIWFGRCLGNSIQRGCDGTRRPMGLSEESFLLRASMMRKRVVPPPLIRPGNLTYNWGKTRKPPVRLVSCVRHKRFVNLAACLKWPWLACWFAVTCYSCGWFKSVRGWHKCPSSCWAKKFPDSANFDLRLLVFRYGHKNCNLYDERWTNREDVAGERCCQLKLCKASVWGGCPSIWLVRQASSDSCLHSMQVITTCLCTQNNIALVCDSCQFHHPCLTLLFMWMWIWWSVSLFGT